MAEHPKPRLLIEEWLPAAAIGVECMRERGTGQNPPNARLHVWWARRPLCASRAAVLASLLPSDFPHDVFERCLGMVGKTGEERVLLRALMDSVGAEERIGFGCPRAFKTPIPSSDLQKAHSEIQGLWGTANASVLDSMAGGGSIPLEAARLGLNVFANEYNPVACSVLEATVDYPFRFGPHLGSLARKWGQELRKRFVQRMGKFYPDPRGEAPTYIFAHTVPCPDTGFATPIVPDWHLLKPKTGTRIVANPIVDRERGTWSVEIKILGKMAGELREPPLPTYKGGNGISLFSGRPISGDWVKQKAQSGQMGSTLYAVAHKSSNGVQFRTPAQEELDALKEAEVELATRRVDWERRNITPNEGRVKGDCDRSFVYGVQTWKDMFTPRQLLAMGTLVEELGRLRAEINAEEGTDRGEAVVHLLAIVIDKFANYNANLCSWHAPRAVVRSVFDRHDFSFKATFLELAACTSGSGIDWAIDNVAEAYEELAELVGGNAQCSGVTISQGSATDLPSFASGGLTAIVVDPPYDDNVQYSELADFFYVWLKRTQGHRRPEWFNTFLCDSDQEAVVNVGRHATGGLKPKAAQEQARVFYRKLMMETFRESRRILRDDGVLTVMFTHKKQEAWEALFGSLVEAGFVITATWPVKTESEHSLHQAKKNAAQSTVILVARKRPPGAGKGFFTGQMQDEIRGVARACAIRLRQQGLNAVDQLVGSFGPAMEVYSRFDQVVTDTGVPVAIGEALDIASEAVSSWRVEQLAARGLDGVEAEGRFALLCWDVLGAEEFRFNEAKLLGHAVGMDVESLVVAGLVTKSGDKIKMVPARDRKREDALKPEEIQTLFGTVVVAKKGKKKDVLKVHPGDAGFRTALDACHAMAIEYIEGRDPQRGIALVKALSRRHGWTKDSDAVRLMEALVVAAPDGVRFDRGKTSAGAQFPEFRAWHHILGEVFGLEQPEWKMKVAAKTLFDIEDDTDEEEEEGDEE